MTLRNRSIVGGLLLATVMAAVLSSDGPTTLAAGNVITSPDPGGDGYHLSLALDSSGNPVVSYYDETSSDLKVLHCNDVYCAGGDESIVSPDIAGSVGSHTSLALDGSGNSVVSYYDASNTDLKLLHCNDANCAGGDESIVSPDTAGSVGSHTSLALDGSGNPVVSYYDASNTDLKLLHCNDANCDDGDDGTTTPDTGSGSGVGKFTSLVLDGSGFPVVSYQDFEDGDLKVLHCNDVDCAGGNESITAVDTGGLVGEYTSLALDGAGNPVVSYFDFGNGDLKVLHCNDADCSGGNESITSPDTAGTVGEFTSLAVDSLGNPVISYYDRSTLSLNVMRCNDANCAGGNESVTSPDGMSSHGTQQPRTSLKLDGGGSPIVAYTDSDGPTVLHCAVPTCGGKGAADTDGDGCADQDEAQTGAGSETSGGQRDYLDPHDYFNPDGDGVNRIDDVLDVVNAYFVDDTDGNPGLPPYVPGYSPATDRSNMAASPHPWSTAAPDGLQRVQDILHMLNQYFHDCA